MWEATAQGTVRVGTDLMSVSEVASSIDRFGDRYLRRVFTPAELAACAGPSGPSAARLAARFAAKECAVKILHPIDGVHFHDIEVQTDRDGRPSIAFHGTMADRARALGIVDSSLSLSEERGLATAILVAVIAPAPRLR